ncbi:hypothetical protein EV647_1469 [Kribbella sp. VKM Ac-2566]|nr:hypothetical protein EV647_1469 [Kribbella sp. VKM Ac-2566]
MSDRHVRKPEPSLPYRWPRRWLDAWAGKRDGRIDLAMPAADAADPATESGSGSAWLSNNLHTFANRDRREYLVAEASVAERRACLEQAVVNIRESLDAVRRAGDRLRALPDPTEEELCRRGPAEGPDSDDVVAARRRLEHMRKRVKLVAEVSSWTDRLAGYRRAFAELDAEVRTAFDNAAARSGWIRELHERRASVYRRGYLRALRRRFPDSPVTSAHPIMAYRTIQAPAWTAACTWSVESPTGEVGAPLVSAREER